MSWNVYILLCDGKTYYVGFTTNIKKRLAEHKSKISIFTKRFSEITLVYFEEYSDENTAKRREKQLKGWSIAKKKALINNEKSKLVQLSRSTEIVEDVSG